MVIDDFHLVDAIVAPFKTNTPLLVDADAVLALAVSLQGLQPVTRRNPERLQGRGGMQLQQLPTRYALDISEPDDLLAMEEAWVSGQAKDLLMVQDIPQHGIREVERWAGKRG